MSAVFGSDGYLPYVLRYLVVTRGEEYVLLSKELTDLLKDVGVYVIVTPSDRSAGQRLFDVDTVNLEEEVDYLDNLPAEFAFHSFDGNFVFFFTDIAVARMAISFFHVNEYKFFSKPREIIKVPALVFISEMNKYENIPVYNPFYPNTVTFFSKQLLTHITKNYHEMLRYEESIWGSKEKRYTITSMPIGIKESIETIKLPKNDLFNSGSEFQTILEQVYSEDEIFTRRYLYLKSKIHAKKNYITDEDWGDVPYLPTYGNYSGLCTGPILKGLKSNGKNANESMGTPQKIELALSEPTFDQGDGEENGELSLETESNEEPKISKEVVHGVLTEVGQLLSGNKNETKELLSSAKQQLDEILSESNLYISKIKVTQVSNGKTEVIENRTFDRNNKLIERKSLINNNDIDVTGENSDEEIFIRQFEELDAWEDEDSSVFYEHYSKEDDVEEDAEDPYRDTVRHLQGQVAALVASTGMLSRDVITDWLALIDKHYPKFYNNMQDVGETLEFQFSKMSEVVKILSNFKDAEEILKETADEMEVVKKDLKDLVDQKKELEKNNLELADRAKIGESKAESYRLELVEKTEILDNNNALLAHLQEENQRLSKELEIANFTLEDFKKNPDDIIKENIEFKLLLEQNEEFLRDNEKKYQSTCEALNLSNQLLQESQKTISQLQADLLNAGEWIYPETLNDVVEAGKRYFNNKLIFHDRLYKSINEFAQGDYKNSRVVSEAVKMLKALVEVLYPMKFENGSFSQEEFLNRTGIPFSMTEGKATKKDSALEGIRTCYWNGKKITFFPHLKSTIQGTELRMHFQFLEEEKKIIICHLGSHLPTSATRLLN
jgi:hypothetical protein